MRLLVISGLFLLSACGGGRSSFVMGETTRAEVLSQKGSPNSEVSLPHKDGLVLKYNDDESIQLEGDIVTYRFTNPSGDQKLLMWWKHKFKNCLTITETLAQNPGSHTPPEIEFACPSEGLSVIYTEGSDVISRVVENAKK